MFHVRFSVADCKQTPKLYGEGEVAPVKASYVNGDEIKLECDSGFKHQGVTSARCEDGSFTEEKFVCEKRESKLRDEICPLQRVWKVGTIK